MNEHKLALQILATGHPYDEGYRPSFISQDTWERAVIEHCQGENPFDERRKYEN